MSFRVWYSTEDNAQWLISNTKLLSVNPDIKKLAESDANNPKYFHRIPDHLKKILYLDAPDIIIEKDREPILAIEISKEAGTGHNAFQRFARIAAAVENNVPAIYIYPEATFITRKNAQRWDRINPNIFLAMERLMQIYNIPALLFYHPTHYRRCNPNPPPNPIQKGLINDNSNPSAPDSTNYEMQLLFNVVNLVVNGGIRKIIKIPLINQRLIVDRRVLMQNEYTNKGGAIRKWSPDTSTITVPTKSLIDYISCYAPKDYQFGELLTTRKHTVIYNINANFRGDPYPGALAALDYIRCRVGKTFEERDKNLVLAWGNVILDSYQQKISLSSNKNISIIDFVNAVCSVRKLPTRCLLGTTNYSELRANDIPRYYMQTRYGCTFTKIKPIRVYSFFADAIIFPDGALWREG